jgi:hypothetical protein
MVGGARECGNRRVAAGAPHRNGARADGNAVARAADFG